MAQKKQPIERKLYPSYPVTLQVEGGEPVSFNITLNFDALLRIEEKTGLKLLDKNIIAEMLSLRVMSAAFWGAVCENHPEYESDAGLLSLRSLLTDTDNLAKVEQALWESYLLCLPAKRRDAILKAREEMQKKENPSEDPTQPSKPMSASTETSIGQDSPPLRDSTSDSALASSAS
jgi:hypothetical protein